MSDIGDELIQGMKNALAHARGRKRATRETVVAVSVPKRVRKEEFLDGPIVDDHAVTGVLYPSFEAREILANDGKVKVRGADVRPYTQDGEHFVDPGRGTSLFDEKSRRFRDEFWWFFKLPRGTVIPGSLQIVRGEYSKDFKATHYQIEPAAKRMRIQDYKAALDNLARNAVVKLYQDARSERADAGE